MLGLIKGREVWQFVVLVVLFFLLRLPFLATEIVAPAKFSGGYLEPWFYNQISQKIDHTTLQILGMLWIALSLLLASFAAVRARLFGKSGLIAAICMLLLLCMHPQTASPSPALILLPLLILFFLNSLGLYAAYKPISGIVNAGAIAAVGYLLYHPFLWVALASFVMLAQLRAFRIKEWLQLLTGLMLPVYVLLSIQYLTDTWQPEELLPKWGYAAPQSNWNAYWWLYTGTYALLCMAALGPWRTTLNRSLIQSRKNWYVLLLTGLLLLPSTIWPAQNFLGALTLLSFPAGMYVSNIFWGESSWWKNLLFWLWLAVILTMFIAYFQGNVKLPATKAIAVYLPAG